MCHHHGRWAPSFIYGPSPLSVLIHYSYVSNTYTWVRVCVLVACKYAESCAPLLPMTLSINIILIWRKEQTLLEGKKKNEEKMLFPSEDLPPNEIVFREADSISSRLKNPVIPARLLVIAGNTAPVRMVCVRGSFYLEKVFFSSSLSWAPWKAKDNERVGQVLWGKTLCRKRHHRMVKSYERTTIQLVCGWLEAFIEINWTTLWPSVWYV